MSYSFDRSVFGRSLRMERLEERKMLAADSGRIDYLPGYSRDSEIATDLSVSVQSPMGDLNGDGEVDTADFIIASTNVGASELHQTDGDFNEDGVINAADWGVLFANWTGETNIEPYATTEMEVFYWPEYTPDGHSRMLKLNPFADGIRIDNIEIDEVTDWLKESGWTREGPNAILLTMGGWMEVQATELFEGEDGMVTVQSIADHIRNDMKNWQRATNWWAAYLQVIKNAGYEVDLIAMDIEAGLPYRHSKYSPPGGPEIPMLEVINYLYSNERWARDLPELDLEALNEQNVFGVPKNEQAMIAWDHWVAKKNAEAWTEVFAETAKAVYPEIIVNNFDYSSYEGAPLLDATVGLPRANAAVDGNSSPVLYLHDNYGYKRVQDALSAFETVRGEGNQPHTIVPWIGGPHHEGTEGWYVTEENFEELKYELQQQGVQFLLVF